MQLLVLDKNKKLGYDNSKWSFKDIFKKLKEEVNELEEAIEEGNKVHIAEEVLDIIQISIAALFKLFMNGVNIGNAISIHNKKLEARGWKPRAVIKINVNRR